MNLNNFKLQAQKKEQYEELQKSCNSLHETCVQCQEGTPYEQIECYNFSIVQIFFKRTYINESRIQAEVQLKELF